MQRIAATIFVAILGARVCAAQHTKADPPLAPTPVLVELFTSEGCSSCPPADALLAKLDGTIAPSGQQIIALSEHVTYWNQLGWTDPFSLRFFTDRQNTYAERFGQDEVYTPQVVVNGARGVLGSDRSALLKTVSMEGLPLPLTMNLLSYRPNGDGLSVMFTVSGTVPEGGAEVYAVLADDKDTTSVAHGENAGRTLSHVAVARAVGKGMVLKPGEQTLVSIPLSAALRAQPADGRRLVLIAQLPGQGRVVGVATQEVYMEVPPSSRKASERKSGATSASIGR